MNVLLLLTLCAAIPLIYSSNCNEDEVTTQKNAMTQTSGNKRPRIYHVKSSRPKTLLLNPEVTKVKIEAQKTTDKRRRRIRISKKTQHQKRHHSKRHLLPATIHEVTRPSHPTLATTKAPASKLDSLHTKNGPLGPHGHGPHGGNYRL